MRDPLPHQLPALDYMQAHRLAGCFMDKRLGKTYVAGRWAKMHGAKRTLVVAPYSAIPGWLDELEADGDLVWDLTNLLNFRTWEEYDGDIPAQFFTINPQGLFKAGKGELPTPKSIALWNWDAVIWDEITTIKNPQSQVNKIAHMCLGSAPLRCGLSGEYAPEGPQDVFEIMRWIFGSFMGRTNFWKWRNEFFEEAGYDWFPKKGMLSEIKRTVMERAFVLSRKDAGLGEIVASEQRHCELPPRLKKVYDHAEVYFEVPSSEVPEVEGFASAEARQALRNVRYTSYLPVVRNWLCQIAGGRPKEFPDLHSDHKLKLLWEIVGEERKHEPLVVSFRHNVELEAANQLLQKRGVTTTMVRGGVPVEERRRRSQAFRDGKVRVVLKQAKVHFGLDLSAADTMIRYSIPDAFVDISQDRDRIVHPVKKRPLLYIDLITKDTVDADLAMAAGIKNVDARFFMTKLMDSFSARIKHKMMEKA